MPLFTTDADLAVFRNGLRTQFCGKRLEFFPRTGSTNDLALAAAKNGAAHGHVFIADAQDQGRGRRGRKWDAAPGSSLLLSVVLRPEHTPRSEFGWLPLIAGLACLEALAETCGVQASLKWPNDVVLPDAAAPGWRKLGGILCESAPMPAAVAPASVPAGREAGPTDYVVLGIGLNANQTADQLPRGKAPPTSVRVETGRDCARLELLRALLESLDRGMLRFAVARQRPALKCQIEERLAQWWTRERVIRAEVAGRGREARLLEGSFAGLDVWGRLKLKVAGREVLLPDGEIMGVL